MTRRERQRWRMRLRRLAAILVIEVMPPTLVFGTVVGIYALRYRGG